MRFLERVRCGRRVRPLFEKASESFDDPEGTGGADLGKAQLELQKCLGKEPDPEESFEEIERWFSYFSLRNAKKGLREGKSDEAVELLRDLEESYSPSRRKVLGIEQDLGPAKTELVYRLTRSSRRLAEKGAANAAARSAGAGERVQYWLNISKAGTPPPE